LGEEGEIFAFEPHPENAQRLRENCELNNSNVEVLELALADESGEVEMEIESQMIGSQAHKITSSQGDIEVPVSSGDEIVSELAPPSVMKIDVEGAEMETLKGFRETINNNPPRSIYLEIHHGAIQEFGSTADELITYLSNHSYNYVH